MSQDNSPAPPVGRYEVVYRVGNGPRQATVLELHPSTPFRDMHGLLVLRLGHSTDALRVITVAHATPERIARPRAPLAPFVEASHTAMRSAGRLPSPSSARRQAARRAVDQLLTELDAAFAPVQQDQEGERLAYLEHEAAARVDVHAQHRDLLTSACTETALRMTKQYALQTIRHAAQVPGDDYLLARTRGILAALDELDPLQ